MMLIMINRDVFSVSFIKPQCQVDQTIPPLLRRDICYFWSKLNKYACIDYTCTCTCTCTIRCTNMCIVQVDMYIWQLYLYSYMYACSTCILHVYVHVYVCTCRQEYNIIIHVCRPLHVQYMGLGVQFGCYQHRYEFGKGCVLL